MATPMAPLEANDFSKSSEDKAGYSARKTCPCDDIHGSKIVVVLIRAATCECTPPKHMLQACFCGCYRKMRPESSDCLGELSC